MDWKMPCPKWRSFRSGLNGLSAQITVTSKWALWCPKSPAYRLFAQPFVQAQIKEDTKAGLYEGNPSVTGGVPSQRASNDVNASIWWRHHGFCYVVYNIVWWCYSGILPNGSISLIRNSQDYVYRKWEYNILIYFFKLYQNKNIREEK